MYGFHYMESPYLSMGVFGMVAHFVATIRKLTQPFGVSKSTIPVNAMHDSPAT